MKAISVLNPWAVLLAIGAKRFETRSWETDYRGPIAIHASKKFTGVQHEICFSEPFATVLMRELFGNEPLGAFMMHRIQCGAVLATGELTCCLPTESIAAGLSDQERAFGDFTPGRFAWGIERVKLLKKPVVCAGRLGLWEWEQ